MSNFAAISWREHAIFNDTYDDDVRLVLDHNA